MAFKPLISKCMRPWMIPNSYTPFHTSSMVSARRWKERTELPFQHDLVNPVDIVYGGSHTFKNGYIYDKKPMKISCKKYHAYYWCGCGLSRQQPLCDKTCRDRVLRLRNLVKGGHVKYIAPEDRDIWFCNCKQTKNRPFCDGTHQNPEIQLAELPGKMNPWEPKKVLKT